MALSALLQNFYQTLLDNNSAQILPALKTNPRISAEKQMAVYIDGYRIRLIHAIRSDYPAFSGLIGEAAFDRLALQFIEQNPPSNFNLDRYPHTFAAFVQNSCSDFASDVARLEGVIAEVFMMEESAPLTAEDLSATPPENLPGIILGQRKAAKLLQFSYNVHTWLNELREGKNPAAPSSEPIYLYIYRHNNNVQRANLEPAQYALLANIFSNITLEAALEKTIAQYPEYEETIALNLMEWFKEWTLAGFFISV